MEVKSDPIDEYIFILFKSFFNRLTEWKGCVFNPSLSSQEILIMNEGVEHRIFVFITFLYTAQTLNYIFKVQKNMIPFIDNRNLLLSEFKFYPGWKLVNQLPYDISVTFYPNFDSPVEKTLKFSENISFSSCDVGKNLNFSFATNDGVNFECNFDICQASKKILKCQSTSSTDENETEQLITLHSLPKTKASHFLILSYQVWIINNCMTPLQLKFDNINFSIPDNPTQINTLSYVNADLFSKSDDTSSVTVKDII